MADVRGNRFVWQPGELRVVSCPITSEESIANGQRRLAYFAAGQFPPPVPVVVWPELPPAEPDGSS